MVELGCMAFGKPEVTLRRWKPDWTETFDAEGNPDDAGKQAVDKYLSAYSQWVKTWKAGEAAMAAAASPRK
jgi:hypothetical protein